MSMFGLGKKKNEPVADGGDEWRKLVALHGLEQHPKGGFYRETYRSPVQIPGVNRPYSTAILFLLPAGVPTSLARLKYDEVVHYHLGGPMIFVKISPSGLVVEIPIGPDMNAGHQLQHVIPAGWWFGAYLNPGVPYAMIGCTVAPGFDFADNEYADRARLMKEFPQARVSIERFVDPAKPQ
jgi:uncharacterized protein